MKTKLLIPVVAICLAALSPVAAADSVTEVFQKALFEEEANQNYDAAMRAYREVVAQMDQQRKLAATAVFRLGECYRKLGQTNEAVAQYQRIVRDFPDQPTLVNLSRQNLAGLRAPSEIAGALPEASASTRKSQEVQLLERQLFDAQAEFARLDRLLTTLKGQSSSDLKQLLPTLQPDTALSGLVEQEIKAIQKRAELKVQFAEQHPDVKAVDATLKEIGQQIAERLEGILRGIEIQRKMARDRADETKKKLNEAQEAAAPRDSGAAPVMSKAARLEQKRLLEEAIKLAEKQLASTKQMVETGRAPSNDLIAREQEILALRLQLAGLDLGSAGTASPIGTAESGATDEEDKEVRRIQAMIKNSPDLINTPGADDVTPLESTARKGQLVVARFLLDNKADPNFRARYGNVRFPLTAAAANGHKAMVELLLARGADVNGDDGGALRIAATKGFKSVVESLLAAKANPNARDYRGETALHRAVENRLPAIAELLIKNGADVNAVNRVGKPGDDPNQVGVRQADGTPLHIVASQGDVAMVSLLLSNRADVNLVNFLGETPLHVSASQLPIVTNLLAAGADVNRAVADGPFKGWTPLHYTVSWNGTNSAKALLEAGADPNAYAARVPEPGWPDSRVGYTPLLMAVTKRQPAMVRLLLENKADPNKEMPLGVAVLNGDIASTRALLDHEAKVNVVLESGETPLTTAVLRGNDEMVRLLLEHKADVNAKAKTGLTALHNAVRLEKKDIVEVLLAAKADLNAVDDRGRTPLDYTTPNLQGIPGGIPRGGLGVPLGVPMSTMGQPAADKVSTIADLLRKGGASEWTPRPGQITLVRKSTGAEDVPFTQGTNQLNYHTLYEAIASRYHWFSFPDFRKITVTRRDAKTGKLVEIPMDVKAFLDSGDCSKDPRLEWGDLVDIPEREHKLGENWLGEPEFGSALAACLARTVTISVRDQIRTNELKAASRPAGTEMVGGKPVGFVFTPFPFRLSPFVKNSGLLLTTSDLSRVRVRRTDPATGQKRDWTFDLTRPEDPVNDLWLRDGDEIEVPDK